MRKVVLIAAAALMLAAPAAAAPASLARTSLDAQAAGTCGPAGPPCFRLASTIAFTSTRDNPTVNPAFSFEIYLINPDGTNARRLTDNNYGDGFPVLSRDGKKIVFDSNRLTAATGTLNVSDLFVMNTDGTDQTLLTRGTQILFSCRIGGGTTTFEICVMNADGTGLVRLTDNAVPDLTATWSPDGQQIVFHRPPVVGQPAQLFTMKPVLNPDGTLPTATQLTFPPGLNVLANWGELRVHDPGPAQ